MTIQEKRPIIFLVIDCFTFAVYYMLLLSNYAHLVEIMGELPFWGASLLLIAPVMIILRVALYLVFSMFNTLATKKKEEKFLNDEFGRLIKLQSSRNFGNAFMACFVMIMALLTTGISVGTMFQLLFFSILIAFVVQNLSTLYYTRKGL